MNIMENLQFFGEDTRKRKFLRPEAVVKTAGEVRYPEKLLNIKPMQIGLCEPEVTELENKDGKKASVILDFGVEIHGGVRILAAFHKGTKNPLVTITFGESLSEVESMVGEKGASNDHAARQFTVPVPSLSDQEWGQTGFRYVKLELQDEDTLLKLKTVAAVFVYHDYKYIGSFECDDAEINKIYDTAAYTCHLCLQNLVWDGIKRDRLVWIGDMMIETMTVRNIFGRQDIVEKSLDFVRDQTPLPGWMNNMPAYSFWWILILYDWYFATGNYDYLTEQKDYLVRLSEQLCSHIEPDGNDTINNYFLDWPTEANPKKKWAVRGLLKMSLLRSAELLTVLGDTAMAEKCKTHAKLLEKIKGDAGDVKQIAAVMSLSDQMDSSVAADIIEKDGINGFSTFMGYHLPSALAKAGRFGSALKLMKEYYAELLNKKATSFFEDYNAEWSDNSTDLTELPEGDQRDIHGDFGAYCYKGFRHSFCHGWAAGPVPYLTEYVLGVTILEPGCKKLKIEPHLDGLKWVKGKFPTPYGVVSIEHTLLSDGKIDSKIEAPEEVQVVLG